MARVLAVLNGMVGGLAAAFDAEARGWHCAAAAVMELVAPLEAWTGDNAARLSLAQGIGKKTAERLIVDFRGSSLLIEAATAAEVDTDGEVVQALEALGYKKAEIKKAMGQFGADAGEGTAARVRTALRILSRR